MYKRNTTCWDHFPIGFNTIKPNSGFYRSDFESLKNLQRTELDRSLSFHCQVFFRQGDRILHEGLPHQYRVQLVPRAARSLPQASLRH